MRQEWTAFQAHNIYAEIKWIWALDYHPPSPERWPVQSRTLWLCTCLVVPEHGHTKSSMSCTLQCCQWLFEKWFRSRKQKSSAKWGNCHNASLFQSAVYWLILYHTIILRTDSVLTLPLPVQRGTSVTGRGFDEPPSSCACDLKQTVGIVVTHSTPQSQWSRDSLKGSMWKEAHHSSWSLSCEDFFRRPRKHPSFQLTAKSICCTKYASKGLTTLGTFCQKFNTQSDVRGK